jgi:hypothetical protein
MTNLTLGFLIGISTAAWVYSKMMRSTGNNTKNALIVAAIAGLFAMVLSTTLIGAFTPNS